MTNDIQAAFLSNFAKEDSNNVTTFNTPYDFGSVMHYNSLDFAKSPDKPTIVTKPKTFQRTIGQRTQPSFLDVYVMNQAYCESKKKLLKA